MKKVLFSGIQPTGIIHIGNLFGAINQWVELQDKYNSIFCIVDLHAITMPQDAKELRKNIINTAKLIIATGIDPNKNILFVQSQIPEHLELYWILNSITKVSELQLMTQFKDKSEKNKIKGASAGLLNYPVLMASDILLYDTSIIPVGEDQQQHIELSRELAKRFNSKYGETFIIPKEKILKHGARIKGLDNPKKKMSKSSSSPKNYIAITDTPKEIIKKIKSAQTDSEKEIKFDMNNKPGISNLMLIMSFSSQKTLKEIEREYKGTGYGEFKENVAKSVIKYLEPIQKRIASIHDSDIKLYLHEGQKKAQKIARKKIGNVYKKIGLIY